MKNKKIKMMFTAIMATALCISLAGCSDDTKTSQTNTSSKAETSESVSEESAPSEIGIEIPERYDKEAENVSFKTDINVSENVRENGLRKLSATVQKPDPAKVFDCLMGDTEIRAKNEEDNNYWYEGVNNEILTINNTSIGFSTNFYVYVSNAFRLQQGYSDYNADKYELDKDLEFASRQEAFENIRQALETMGIDIEEQYKCYVLEHSMLQSEEYALQLEKVFAFTEQESNYDLKPFEEIAEVIETKYGMLLDGSTYSVNQATLYYMKNKMNDEQYEVIPVWIFNTEDKETGKTLQDIVNAETGKEIVWEEK